MIKVIVELFEIAGQERKSYMEDIKINVGFGLIFLALTGANFIQWLSNRGILGMEGYASGYIKSAILLLIVTLIFSINIVRYFGLYKKYN